LANHLAAILFEDDVVATLAERQVQLARRTGALADLPAALHMQSVTLTLTGELARAAELAAEGTAIAHAIGAVPLPQAELFNAGWRGHDAGAAFIDATLARAAIEQLDDDAVSIAHYALAVLHSARGDYGPALTAATRAAQTDELTCSNLALPEIVEAATRAGDPARAQSAVEELEMRARATGGSWGLGLAARSRALITAGPAAEKHFLEALDLLERHRLVSYRARTHLVYGEWLRREGRRQDAREQLRTAHRLLTGMGADAFAERAAKELRATGEHPRKRTAHATDALTTHELQVARLVATGATTREVAQQLFLSPRTIEAHLRNIFRKLGITSRRQLKDLQLSTETGP
jgi:DNA-binding CsgD family transcriptional regulator